MTLTSSEAADVLGISTGGMRMLVARQTLRPIRPGAHPLRFHALDVYELQVRRRTVRERAEHEALWAEVDTLLASQVSGV